MNLQDRLADAGAGSAVVVPVVATMTQINIFLQAGAFIVAIVSGIMAARYYWKKAK